MMAERMNAGQGDISGKQGQLELDVGLEKPLRRQQRDTPGMRGD